VVVERIEILVCVVPSIHSHFCLEAAWVTIFGWPVHSLVKTSIQLRLIL
jgi:hypothetical protein